MHYKYIFLFISLYIGGASASLAEVTERYMAGSDYQVLYQGAKGKNNIHLIESFWSGPSYRCQALFRHIEKNLPKQIKIDKYQIYLQRYTPERYDESINLLVLSKIEKREPAFSDYVYKQHFRNVGHQGYDDLESFMKQLAKRMKNVEEEIALYPTQKWSSFMLSTGPLAGIDYDSTSKRFAFKSLVEKYKKKGILYASILKRFPAIIVNDKYQIPLKDSDCVSQPDSRLVEMIQWLNQN